MENLHKDFIYLDGMWLKEEQLLKLAKNAGSMVIAEHYLCAYLLNAVINGKSDAIDKVNEVRAVYGLDAIPYSDIKENCSNRRDTKADLARKKYLEMVPDKQQAFLSSCLKLLMEHHKELFKSKTYWTGIYLVVRDRFDSKIRKSDFPDLVRKITPSDWPHNLLISDTTLSNFSHYLDYCDRGEAYYDMKNNPWEDLCMTFWDIVEYEILTGQ